MRLPRATRNLEGALTALVLALAPLTARAQPAPELPPAIQAEVQAAQDALARGVGEFDGPQQSRSIVVFDEVIARLEALGARALPPRGKDVLAQAYEYRGRAYFGIGLSEKASENFRQLVQLKPDHALSKERVSPKVVELFDSVKRTLVGRIAVSSEPAGATVTLVSPGGLRTELGLTDFFPIEVLAGEYALEVARAGYRTETLAVSIAAEATETRAVPLTRVLASAWFVVEPAGVEIWIDGELRATTAGNLAPEHHEAARAKGLDPARAAARVEIPNLSLGSHALELRRRCYQGVKRTLDTPEPRDYDHDAIRLEDSLASLKLSSDPPGARILLNGEARGVTPAQIDGICSGKVRVEVKHAAGKFVKDLVLEKDEALSLDCPMRPTLAFIGVEAASAGGLRHLADADERIQQNLAQLSSLNFIAAPREAVDRMLEQDKLTRLSLLPGSGSDPDLVRKVTDRMAASLDVQGFLIAVLPEERLQRTARLHLLAAGNTTAEAVEVVFAEGPAYAPLVKRLDVLFASERPWSGVVTVDTLTQEGVPVLRVVPGSPAEKAGIVAGDVVLGADGQPVKATADLLAAVAAKKPGDKLVLHVRGAAAGAQPRGVELALGASAREIPLFDPQLVYNKAMMDLRAVVEGYPGTEAAAYARLNLALCAMHFSDYAGAHEYLQKAKAELPLRPGLSRGTALYYLGLALDKLGYRPQAVEAYRAAADAKDATLIDNDGPAVASLAARRAGP
ncbi:MAG TPA: PDZ domain-containing protein [Vicinamibacteria bacterium]|jgi:tetratricopeptide (TPR) repeat protein